MPITNKMTPTPMPIPAFAPVLRPASPATASDAGVEDVEEVTVGICPLIEDVRGGAVTEAEEEREEPAFCEAGKFVVEDASVELWAAEFEGLVGAGRVVAVTVER